MRINKVVGESIDMRAVVIEDKVLDQAEKFLKQRGYENPVRVDFVEFSRRASEEGFKVMDETNEIEVNGIVFLQGYGVNKDGGCVYVTLIN